MVDLRTILDPPEEHVLPTDGRGVVPAILIALALLAAANAVAFVETEHRPRNRGYEVVAHKWTLASELESAPDWLFVGDSSCNQGVIPQVFEEVLGGTALNLCTIGSATVADDAWIADYVIDRVGPPGAIVVVHTWDTWPRPDSTLRSMLWRIPIGSDAWEGREPAIALTARDRLTARFGRWLPLYTQNISLRQAVTNPGGAPTITFEDGGFMPMNEASPEAARYDLDKHRRTVAAEDWSASAWSRASLQALIDVARAHEVPVYLAMAPAHEDLVDEPDFERWMADYAALLHDAAATEGVTVIADRPFAVAPEMLEKVDHVNVEGARAYSSFLAERLAAHRPSSR